MQVYYLKIMLCICFLSYGGYSCSKSNTKDINSSDDSAYKSIRIVNQDYSQISIDSKRRWIEKLFSSFGINRELDTAQIVTKIESLVQEPSRENVWKYILSTSAFSEWITKFFMYQLGFLDLRVGDPDSSITSYYAIGGSLADYSNVLHAAHLVLEEKNFISALFNNEGRVYLGPLVDQDHSRNVNMDNHVYPGITRRENLKFLRKYLGDLKTIFKEDWDQDSECKIFFKNLQKVFSSLFIKPHIEVLLLRSLSPRMVGDQYVNSWGLFHENCLRQNKISTQTEIQNAIDSSVSKLMKFIEYLESFEPSNYSVNSVLDISELDLIKMNLSHERESLYVYGLLKNLPNTFSNLNRKRSQWIYSQLLCEKSLPIHVEDLDSDHSDPHLNQALCFGCHFKLDPTAGFFRHYGRWGIRFFENQVLILDEGTNVALNDYVSRWNYMGNTQVFFSQSLNERSLGILKKRNIFSADLGDLFSEIKDRKELYRCLVQRMVEFSNVPNKQVDQASQNQLADALFDLRKQDSNKLLVSLLDRVFFSPYFFQEDDSSSCVSISRNPQDPIFPPCDVREILKNHCDSCHNINLASGGLDLSSFHQHSFELGFVHKFRNGEPLSRKESAALILSRVSTNSPVFRMPPKHSLSKEDLDTLKNWLKSLLDKSN